MSLLSQPPRRIANAIVNSLGAGVVPRVGIEYINVGRSREIGALISDLDAVADGGAAFRFIVGRYGSGKTFMLQLLRNQAIERGFVVADVDLSPERRLTSASHGGLNSYRELMKNLSTRARPDGGALPAILERWISTIQSEVMVEHELQPGSDDFNRIVKQQIFAVIDEMEGMVHGFDYAKVIAAYWDGYVSHDEALQDAALRWLRGEFATKTEARQALDVRIIVDDSNWYDFIKLFATFVSSIRYNGLLMLIDEAVNLYKITHRISRENNYEKLLTMFNDTMQGKAAHLFIVVGGTPQFVEDSRRGLYSYEALATRLARSRFADERWVDVSGPVISLKNLDHNELFLLLIKVRDVYIAHSNHDPQLGDDDIHTFMTAVAARLGAETLLTPREIVRDFLSVLNLLRQNPTATFEQLIGSAAFTPTVETPVDDDGNDGFAEFSL
ncbi:MAG: ATP-binding protein [Anaerolineales bacterium]|nr:ATP-binding protein [Anaerolineales bacterium]MCB9127299.1 ATP-binding protein [Ardenticatenales bacterium]MCB9172588.1 ATP-binding protein [Ardenticatenales bacterium]